MKQLYLFAVKVYKGFFHKKFERSDVGILFPTKTSIFLFIIYLGLYEDPKTGHTQNLGVLAGSIQDTEIPMFLESMMSTYKENFSLIDSANVKVKTTNDSITANPISKSKYLKSPITIDTNKKLSKKHVYVSINGDLPEFFNEEELNDSLAGMKAMNSKSKFSAFMSVSTKGLHTIKY